MARKDGFSGVGLVNAGNSRRLGSSPRSINIGFNSPKPGLMAIEYLKKALEFAKRKGYTFESDLESTLKIVKYESIRTRPNRAIRSEEDEVNEVNCWEKTIYMTWSGGFFLIIGRAAHDDSAGQTQIRSTLDQLVQKLPIQSEKSL